MYICRYVYRCVFTSVHPSDTYSIVRCNAYSQNAYKWNLCVAIFGSCFILHAWFMLVCIHIYIYVESITHPIPDILPQMRLIHRANIQSIEFNTTRERPHEVGTPWMLSNLFELNRRCSARSCAEKWRMRFVFSLPNWWCRLLFP